MTMSNKRFRRNFLKSIQILAPKAFTKKDSTRAFKKKIKKVFERCTNNYLNNKSNNKISRAQKKIILNKLKSKVKANQDLQKRRLPSRQRGLLKMKMKSK